MPLLLSETDLAPLYRDPAAMDSLLDRIEESMRAFNRGAVAGQVRLETSLSDRTKKYRITTSAVPSAGQGMRINALFRGAKDSYFILLFDEERGDLLALVAGAALNAPKIHTPNRRRACDLVRTIRTPWTVAILSWTAPRSSRAFVSPMLAMHSLTNKTTI